MFGKSIFEDVLSDKIRMELENIREWNKKTFPDATLAGQLMKLEEEINEFCMAKKDKKQDEELADVFIVLGGLRRWNSRIGAYYENTLLEDMTLLTMHKLYNSIKHKMEINRKRVWKKSGDGKFHHKKK